MPKKINHVNLESMTVAASVLGWTVPVPVELWPETFKTDLHVWRKDHLTVAENGEVQTGEYRDGEDWLIVFNE